MLIGLVIFGAIIFGFIGLLICIPIFDIDISTLQARMSDGSIENINFLKVFNLITTFGAWVVSAYALIRIRQFSAKTTWQLSSPQPSYTWIAIPFVFISMLFASAFLIEVNGAITIPESLKQFSSKANKQLLENMLMMNGPKDLIVNILIVGLAPALFEEIFFRGTLQKLAIHFFDHAHIGIFITAFIFTAVHLNAEQFIPMLFLALVLGYTCYYTKSIWPSIILHFFNNSFAVIINYYKDKSTAAQQLVEDSYQPPVAIVVISFIAIGAFIYLIAKHYHKQKSLITNE
ncbi:MAG: CPBP family intramembrane glutamic endopeptidase [Bacteroidota bacterium]